MVPRALESNPGFRNTHYYTFERYNETLIITSERISTGSLTLYNLKCSEIDFGRRIQQRVKHVEVMGVVYFTLASCREFFKFEKSTGHLVKLKSPLFCRAAQSLTVFRNRYIVQVGSINFMNGASKSSEIYDITTNVWTRLPDLNFHSQ